MSTYILIGIGLFIAFIWFMAGLRVIQQWDEGLVFLLGKYRGKRQPGSRI